MRRLLLFGALFFATSLFGKDIYFPIAGTVSTLGSFRTDVRLFNPSTTKTITVNAFLLPIGNKNNTSAAAHAITVGPRAMMLLNDVVTTLGGSDLDAIHLQSGDDFVATERVYAQQNASSACNVSGTLGQDVPALDPSVATKQGILLQLRTSTQFRTNIGVLNPNSAAANVTMKLYDKSNNLVSTGTAIAVQPMGVIGPTNMTSGFFFSPGSSTDALSDAWVSYSSDQPVIVYASVVDNGTLDPTFIPMAADSGGTSSTPSTKSVTITVHSWGIDVAGGLTTAILPGDVVNFSVVNSDPATGKLPHGLELDDPNGNLVFSISSIAGGQTLARGPFTFNTQGTYNLYCTQSSCGTATGQHDTMFVQVIVGQPSDGLPRPGY